MTINLYSKMFPKFEYPVARRDETVVDDYHGTQVSNLSIPGPFNLTYVMVVR